MVIDSALIIFISSSLVLFGLLFLYSFFLGRYTERDSEAYKRYQKLMIEAGKKSKVLLDQSISKSAEILKDANGLNITLNKLAKDALDAAVSKDVELLRQQTIEMLQEHKFVAEKAKEDLTKQLKELSDKIEESGNSSLDAFRKHLENQKSVSEAFLQKKLDGEFTKAVEEVNGYKKARLEKIDDQVKDTVMRISKEVLNRSITSVDHEKFVLEALDEAKKEGFFRK